jgi:hypothetical protein
MASFVAFAAWRPVAPSPRAAAAARSTAGLHGTDLCAARYDAGVDTRRARLPRKCIDRKHRRGTMPESGQSASLVADVLTSVLVPLAEFDVAASADLPRRFTARALASRAPPASVLRS